MIRQTINALLACVVTFTLCAVAYPALVYGLGHSLFPRQAEGSLLEREGVVVGSALIAQPFTSARYFAPRPSAAGPHGYAADAASGSNLATTNPALRDRITLDTARRYAEAFHDPALQTNLDHFDALQVELNALTGVNSPSAADQEALGRVNRELATIRTSLVERLSTYRDKPDGSIATDLVTASGSGLDPEISPAAAYFQAERVAGARHLPVEQVRRLIAERIDHSGAILGAPPRVNVLLLNLKLDEPALQLVP